MIRRLAAFWRHVDASPSGLTLRPALGHQPYAAESDEVIERDAELTKLRIQVADRTSERDALIAQLEVLGVEPVVRRDGW